MQEGDLRRRYLHVHRRADARRRVRGRTDLACRAAAGGPASGGCDHGRARRPAPAHHGHAPGVATGPRLGSAADRKSTRLNSSHTVISYAVFCLKKKKKPHTALPIKKIFKITKKIQYSLTFH